VKELDDVYHLPGMLTAAEVDCLFRLGQFNQCQGVIVEIGSWKGKSTVALARGSAKGSNEKIYAIDPHSILPEERYFEDTKSEFLANVARAGVADRVIPMVMTSEEAAKGWKPTHPLTVDRRRPSLRASQIRLHALGALSGRRRYPRHARHH
jgi:predicted O-methyltransferase YrrM